MQNESGAGRKFHIPSEHEDAAISRGIAADPDTHEVGDAEFATLKRMGRPRKDSPKVPVTLRLDADLLAALRDTGQGWQTRVNEALRAWLKP